VIADDAAHAFGENLGPAAGHGIHTSVFKALQHFAVADLRALREVADFDHSEGLKMHFRIALLQPAQHIAIPVE